MGIPAQAKDNSSLHGPWWPELTGDVASAAVAATLVTPPIVVIDRSIVEKASFNAPLLQSLRVHALDMLKRPHRFLFSRPFALVWSLYAATFSVANTTDTIVKRYDATAVGTAVFLSTFIVNVPFGVWKDIRFAQIFGTKTAIPTPASDSGVAPAAVAATVRPANARLVPRTATAIFLARDAVTIYGSFVLPPLLSGLFAPGTFSDPHTEMVATQMTVPVATQLLATPLHLLGLDFMHRQGVLPLTDRLAQMRGNLPATTSMRCVRIIPAFSLGILANKELRAKFQGALKDVQQQKRDYAAVPALLR